MFFTQRPGQTDVISVKQVFLPPAVLLIPGLGGFFSFRVFVSALFLGSILNVVNAKTGKTEQVWPRLVKAFDLGSKYLTGFLNETTFEFESQQPVFHSC
jgi:hypothetical protein